jgi:hypothetical protein
MRGIQELLDKEDGQRTEASNPHEISITITPPTGEVPPPAASPASAPAPAPVPPPPASAVVRQAANCKTTATVTAATAAASTATSGTSEGGATTPRAVATPSKDNTDSSNITSRAKEFLRRDAEKKVAAIMEDLGEEALAYNTIRMHRQQLLTSVDIRTGEKIPAADLGTMTTTLDGKFRLVEKNICLGQKQTKTMECIGCNAHPNVQSFPKRGSNIRGGRQVIWLTDQLMPPVLPVKSGQQCVKIVRLESGSLQELAEGLVRVLSGRQVAAGSAVLLTSATNMAAAGTVGYAADLVAAIKYLKSNLGDHLVYGPLPNLLINGCGDWSIIRTSLEVAGWAMQAFQDSLALLQNSYRLLEKMLGDRMMGEPQPAKRTVLRLPRLDGSTITMSSC